MSNTALNLAVLAESDSFAPVIILVKLLTIMSNTTFIPNSLRERLKAAGLLQKDVAQALGLDCADRISHWEDGTAMPNVVNLFKLAAIFDVMPHELYPELYHLAQAYEPEDESSAVSRSITEAV